MHDSVLPTTVVILALGRDSGLERTLESLAEHALTQQELEVIVVSSSTEDSPPAQPTAGSRELRLRFVTSPTEDHWQLLSHGVACANTDLVVPVLSDSLPSGEALSKVLNDSAVYKEALLNTLEFEYKPDVLNERSLAQLRASAITYSQSDLAPINTRQSDGDPSWGEDEFALESFSLEDSLADLQRMEGLRADATGSTQDFIDQLELTEIVRLNKWLRANPKSQRQVATRIESWAHVDFPYDLLNEGLGKTLVISYTFAPDMGTAGWVMARRIRVKGQVVNVMSNDLSATNAYDPECFQMCAPFVERQIKLSSPPTFGDWRLISAFVDQGMKYIAQNPEWFEQINHLHSRAMQPPSHFLAAMIKLKNPQVTWTAEFSDPLSRGIENQERYRKFKNTEDDPIYKDLRDLLAKRGLLELAGDNVFLWAELIPYCLADEITFANSKHRQYMIENISNPQLREHVDMISRADPHPSPDPRFYDVAVPPIALDQSKINIGYMGHFYDTRRLAELTDALELLSPEERNKLAVTFFSKNPQPVFDRAGIDLDELNISVQPHISYFEALAMQKEFDYMIINDASTTEFFDYNIYLPSKISDTNRDLTKVWGITEPGSLLDETTVDVKSHIGDSEGALKVLREIIATGK